MWLGEAEPGDTLAFASLYARDKWERLFKADQAILPDDSFIAGAIREEPWVPLLQDTRYQFIQFVGQMAHLEISLRAPKSGMVLTAMGIPRTRLRQNY